jgi:hypothetical protein
VILIHSIKVLWWYLPEALVYLVLSLWSLCQLATLNFIIITVTILWWLHLYYAFIKNHQWLRQPLPDQASSCTPLSGYNAMKLTIRIILLPSTKKNLPSEPCGVCKITLCTEPCSRSCLHITHKFNTSNTLSCITASAAVRDRFLSLLLIPSFLNANMQWQVYAVAVTAISQIYHSLRVLLQSGQWYICRFSWPSPALLLPTSPQWMIGCCRSHSGSYCPTMPGPMPTRSDSFLPPILPTLRQQ